MGNNPITAGSVFYCRNFFGAFVFYFITVRIGIISNKVLVPVGNITNTSVTSR